MKKYISLLVIAVVLTGCMTQKKQQRIARAYMHSNPIELATLCSIHFPAKDTFIKGEPDTVTTEVVRRDTVTVQVEGRDIHVPCPECRQKTRTITIVDTIVRLDEASLAVLLDQINVLSLSEAVLKEKLSEKDRQLKESKQKGYKKTWIASALGLLTLIFAWMKFR